jgi:hypothetical protein
MDSPTTVRPSGTVGRVVKARTNAFELTWSERSSVHHYDGVFLLPSMLYM